MLRVSVHSVQYGKCSVSSLDTVTSTPHPASAPRPTPEQLLTRDRGSGGRHLTALRARAANWAVMGVRR